MARLIVRDACSDDLALVVEFNTRLAQETEARTLDQETLHRGVALALAEPDRLRYWVAELDGRVVGQTAITREWSDWRNGWLWWLQSVYIHPDARGRGVFRALHHQIREVARAEPDVIGLRLYVDEENRHAQRTYQALGMDHGGYHVYEEIWADRLSPP